MTRLPRTVRLDVSDASVFDRAALPGEWAVPGGFEFVDAAGAALSPAEHNAFACGFLGTESFGHATLVAVEEASAEDIEAVVTALALHFMRDHGAPTIAQARAAAEHEVRFAAELCDHPIGTLLTVTRRFEGEDIIERFATLTPHDSMAAVHAAPIDLRGLVHAAEEP